MKRIACVSQKGGVGKSTLARDIAVQFSINKWDVRIVDLDDRQTTSIIWQENRIRGGFTPPIHVYGCKNADTALSVNGCDLVVFDGKPYSDHETRKIAESSDLVVIPTGPSLDDLYPQVLLAHELIKTRMWASRILFVLNSITSDLDGKEVAEAREFLDKAGYRVAKSVIMRRSSFGQAQSRGQSISEVSAPTLRAQAVGVIEEIGQLLEIQNDQGRIAS